MSSISGKDGLVSVNGTSAVSSVRDWTINTTVQVAAGNASNSDSMEFSLAGATDFTGTFSGYGTSPLGIVVPGTAYVFYGQTGGSEVTGGIIVTSVTVNCSIESGGLLEWTADFASIGSSTAVYTANNTALTWNAAPTSLTNTSVPAAFSSTVCKASWNPLIAGTAAGLADIDDVLSWSLTLANDAQAYVSSNTGGVTKRVKGRWRGSSASIRVNQGELSVFDTNATRLTAGTFGSLRLYATASAYYDLRYCQVNGLTSNTPIEAGGLVTADVGFAYTGYANVGGTFTKGTIIDPNAVTVWP